MFVITVKGSLPRLFSNELEDDFLQFLPAYFHCDPSDITVEHVGKDNLPSLKKMMSEDKPQVDLTVKGVMNLLKDGKVHGKFDLKKMKEWPYESEPMKDSSGRVIMSGRGHPMYAFKGHQF